MMTKQHFEAIANALAAAHPDSFIPSSDHERDTSSMREYDVAAYQWRRCVEKVADGLACQNPNFKRARFVGACYPR